MRISLVFLIFISLLWSSCNSGDDTTASTANASKTVDTTRIVTTVALKPELRLTTDAQTTIDRWPFYKDLGKSLDSLRQPTLTDLKRTIPNLVVLFDSSEEEDTSEFNLIPHELDVPQVSARLLTVETQVKVLYNLVNKTRPDAQHIGEELTKLFNSFQDLNLQINERFVKDIEDLIKEFDDQSEEDTLLSPLQRTPQNRPIISIEEKDGV